MPYPDRSAAPELPKVARCTGSGGHVYEYEGAQFGRQLIEEPCEACNGWHEDGAA